MINGGDKVKLLCGQDSAVFDECFIFLYINYSVCSTIVTRNGIWMWILLNGEYQQCQLKCTLDINKVRRLIHIDQTM